MKNVCKKICLIGLTLVLVSCSSNTQLNEKPDFEGQILETNPKNQSILLSVDVDRYYEDEDKTELVFLSVSKTSTYNKLEIGQKIHVWLAGELQESYPPKGGATKIRIVE